MEFPLLMPVQFQVLKEVKTDAELLSLLIQQPQQLLSFFENVTEFDSWCEKHLELMHGILQWVTDQYYLDRLSTDYAKRIAQVIHNHYSTLSPFVPLDITVEVEGKDIEMNGVLIGTSSAYLRQRMLKECRDQKSYHLKLERITYALFLFIEEFINTGSAWKLWRKTKDELLQTLEQAVAWELPGLIDAAQVSMKRYIESGNVLDLLIMSHERGWPILKRACSEFIDTESIGVRLPDKGVEVLAFEFLDFKDKAMDYFERLRPYITHLIIGGLLTQDVAFRDVVNRCPYLVGIDIAHSYAFSEHLRYMPTQLQELSLSKCGWLNQNNLREIFQTCPYLKSLDISSNPQLTYLAWGEIVKLYTLKTLDISRCHLLSNDDFKLILMACRGVTTLSCEDCSTLYENAFFDIGRMMPGLISLNVARCTINDSSLIEIATRCKNLARLDLTRCINITKKGILETVKEALQLKVLILTRCNIPDFVIEEAKQMLPFLDVIT